MVWNSQKYRLQYWATRSSVRSFSRSWDSEWLDGYFVCVFPIFDHIETGSASGAPWLPALESARQSGSEEIRAELEPNQEETPELYIKTYICLFSVSS